jgi:hypothetical protein
VETTESDRTVARALAVIDSQDVGGAQVLDALAEEAHR